MMKTKIKGLLPSTYWFIITLLCVFMLLRGIWAMTQPWGNLYQQIFAWLFFFVLFVVALYKFKAARTSGGLWNSEIMKNLIGGIVSATFVIGGVFILLIGTSKDRLWAVAGIVFFGLGGVYYFRKFMKNKNG